MNGYLIDFERLNALRHALTKICEEHGYRVMEFQVTERPDVDYRQVPQIDIELRQFKPREKE